MKNFGFAMLVAAVFIAPIASVHGQSKLPSDNYEQPRHRVLEQVENIEIRRYEPMVLAEVDIDGDRGTAANRAFRILAGYIFGGNVSRGSIAMTSPVTQAETEPKRSEKIAMTSPVTQVAVAPSPTPESTQRWTIAFMMPASQTLATLPKPNDSRIRFRSTEPATRVAIRFAGISSERNLAEHREKLEVFLKSRKLEPVGQPAMAFYDDPFTLPWNRRNEWWVEVTLPASPNPR